MSHVMQEETLTEVKFKTHWVKPLLLGSNRQCRIFMVYTTTKLKEKSLFPFLFSSVQFSFSVVSDSLRPHEPQHAKPPCPSPTPGVHPNPCPLSRWCHTTISSSVVLFPSFLQSFPASESFPMSQFFTSKEGKSSSFHSTDCLLSFMYFISMYGKNEGQHWRR